MQVLEQVYENYRYETDLKANACSPLPSIRCTDVLNTCVTLWTHHTQLHTHHFPLKLLLRETQQLWAFEQPWNFTHAILYFLSLNIHSIIIFLNNLYLICCHKYTSKLIYLGKSESNTMHLVTFIKKDILRLVITRDTGYCMCIQFHSQSFLLAFLISVKASKHWECFEVQWWLFWSVKIFNVCEIG